jgi:DNA-directed RNA polymerase subunit H (RpoH/RPB5)
MTTEIPVDVQLFRCYPFVRELLELRGFDVSEFPALSYEQISQQKAGGPEVWLSPIPPIITAEIPTDSSGFGEHSRECDEIRTKTRANTPELLAGELSRAFAKRYPVLSQVVNRLVDAAEAEPGGGGGGASAKELATVVESVESVVNVYRAFAQQKAEVHFHQCFNPENLWGANSRDRRFMNEMNAMVASMEATAHNLYEQHQPALEHALPKHLYAEYADGLLQELVRVFRSNYTLVYLFRTRSKASSTLDKKYEHYCVELLQKYGIFVQLFNMRQLMFNVTRHEIVPKHEALDVWHDGDEIAQIKRVYNMKNIAKENPCIALGDPQAKFIGLRSGQLCKITRVNPSSGTFITYRYCK